MVALLLGWGDGELRGVEGEGGAVREGDGEGFGVAGAADHSPLLVLGLGPGVQAPAADVRVQDEVGRDTGVAVLVGLVEVVVLDGGDGDDLDGEEQPRGVERGALGRVAESPHRQVRVAVHGPRRVRELHIGVEGEVTVGELRTELDRRLKDAVGVLRRHWGHHHDAVDHAHISAFELLGAAQKVAHLGELVADRLVRHGQSNPGRRRALTPL